MQQHTCVGDKCAVHVLPAQFEHRLLRGDGGHDARILDADPSQRITAKRIGQKLEQQVVAVVRNPHETPLADLIIRDWRRTVQTIFVRFTLR